MHGKAFIDGGARGNPGPAGAGGLIEGPKPVEISKFLGSTTNNVAEYTALILLLKEAINHGYTSLEVYTDSELLARQMQGKYKVKNANLKALYQEANSLLPKFKSFTINHVYRENNKEADRLVNEAIDANT